MDIISQIHQDLKKNIDEKYKKKEARLFKEGRRVYGVRTPVVRQIATKYWREVKTRKKKEIFKLCDQLLDSGFHEPLIIAFQWAHNLRKQYEKSDFEILKDWLEKYVNNWASCDDFCAGPLGAMVLHFPELLPKVFEWTKNKNMWFRRAAAVCLIPSLRKGKYLEQAFRIADTLISDKEDLVQKGYGWMLKEASNVFQKEVFAYVIKNKNKMTRTALRYAIEKIPEKMRKLAMEQ